LSTRTSREMVDAVKAELKDAEEIISSFRKREDYRKVCGKIIAARLLFAQLPMTLQKSIVCHKYKAVHRVVEDIQRCLNQIREDQGLKPRRQHRSVTKGKRTRYINQPYSGQNQKQRFSVA
jgi:hypothetical protein